MTAFKYIRQNGISGPTTQKPTFLPDVPGLYKFDLTAHDGMLPSQPSSVVINVTESPIARGIIPDASFVWSYLSDFWKLIDDTDRLQTFWSGLAQVAASELLNLWQLDYSKSLRDVQRTFQRKWLRYDLLMSEDPAHVESTTAGAIYGGILSVTLSGQAASRLDLSIGGTLFSVVVPATATSDPTELIGLLQPQLDIVDPLIVLTAVVSQDSSINKVRINAPYVFSIQGTSTCTLFAFTTNSYPQGTGTLVGDRTYKVDFSLEGIPLAQGNLIVLDGIAYRISQIATDPSDVYTSQRVTTIDPIPSTGNLLNWSMGGTVTSATLDFWYGAVAAGDHVFLDVVNLSTGEVLPVDTLILGVNAQIVQTMAVNSDPIGSYIIDPTFAVFLRGVLRRNYLPIDRLVQDVPYLQEIINSTDDTQVLRRNVDYFIEAFRDIKVFRFIVGSPDVWQGGLPPQRLWAETTYLDNRPLIEANFGIPAVFTLDDLAQLPSNVDYLSAVSGLWFSYFNGPTLFNLRAGVQILLGLPFAEEAGVIQEIRSDFSSTTGRILVQDQDNTEIVRSYTYPVLLSLEINPDTGNPYEVGDTVAQFAPLIKGVEVTDWVKDPRWIHGYVAQGIGFEVEKFFKFIVAVNSEAFNINALLFAQSFIRRIKPTYTYPIFLVQKTVQDADIDVSDLISYSGRLSLFAGPRYGLGGQAQMWDQPRPGGGGYWNQSDKADPNAGSLTPFTSTHPINWAADEDLLAPGMMVVAKCSQTLSVPAHPVAGDIFLFGVPVFTSYMLFQAPSTRWITTAGTQVGLTTPSTIAATLTRISLFYTGSSDGATLTLTMKKNGTVVVTETFTPAVDTSQDPTTRTYEFTIATTVAINDSIEFYVSHPTSDFNTYIKGIGVVVGVGIDTIISTLVPAGTYYAVFPL